MSAVTYDTIPHSMRETRRWICWDDNKVPYKYSGGRASSTDKRTWGTFDEVVTAYEKHGFLGIGFVLGDGWLGIDWDDVRNPETGEWAPGVLDEIASVQSYAEISPSKTGAHVITYGEKPGNRCRAKGEVWEMYERGRFFTVTGNHIPGTPEDVREAARGSLEAIYAKIDTSKDHDVGRGHEDRDHTSTRQPVDLTDEEVISLCENAANSAKFNALWRGDTSEHLSHSEADLALCNILAFYTQDPGQIDGIFRQSGLYRDKWDREDYRDATISTALQGVRETYTPGRIRKGEGEESFNLTDAGNSERLVRLYGDEIRYCSSFNSWFVWDGRRWEIDETHRMLDFATQTARTIFNEAAGGDSLEKRKAIARWAMRSESYQLRKNMIGGAVFMVPVRSEDLDAQESLFNCLNGTLDLDTGEFRGHRKEDLLTKLAGVEYIPDAKCPLWLEHLSTVFGGDDELIKSFQTVVGYSLLQYNPEQIMCILWGSGKNGKSETLKTIALILNEYAVNIESQTLMESRYTEGGRARPDVLRLRGARFTTCTEPEQNAVLSESLIKSVTGDHKVTARPLYGNPIEFVPGAKIFLATNHLPRIKGTDNGIWRRIWLFPFTATIPADERQPEYGKTLFEKEGQGIFNWMLDGLRRYQNERGLIQSQAMKKEMQEYRIKSNPIGRYIDDWCVIDPRERVAKSDLYGGYKEWCESVGWKPISLTAFGSHAKTLFEEERDQYNRYWIGVRRKTPTEVGFGEQPVSKQMGLGDSTSHYSTPGVGQNATN